MRLCYNLLFPAFFLLSAPYYFWKMWRRGGWQRGFGERFGTVEPGKLKTLTDAKVLWLHAVSVGEVNVCLQLIAALRPRLAGWKFLVSTTTSTGMGELEKKLPADVARIYYPVDFPVSVRRALDAVRPTAVVLVEAEFWPNFLWQLRARGLPVCLANARVSDKSFRGYQRGAFLFRELFGNFAAVGAQNDADAARLRELGCRADAVHVTGNAKFDAAAPSGGATLDVPALLRPLGVPDDAQLLVAGSTHAGEEVLLARMFLRLRERFPKLFLVLVPRHFERTAAVVEELRPTGLRHVLRTELAAGKTHAPGTVDCLLVNTTGELRHFYRHATVVFVGKSLTATGGQNPIEPGALGKAMLFGPHMENFRPIAAEFVSSDAAVQVPDAPALEAALTQLLADPTRRAQLGTNALRVVQRNQGASDRTAEMIVRTLG
ncbi:MAG: 3-deoxy-D-manno-octulosonic acid transferase [Pedosphaera sp. Tous-C6FEB]|nr:MAG: 3-deoxy-D-manno-octulosonic acid transferase [Pedosphaera sp. Tous-C6FEB]